jgi:hypothetical protein
MDRGSSPRAALVRPCLLLLVLACQGCVVQAAAMLGSELLSDDPPRLDTAWAKGARNVISPDTPGDNSPVPGAWYDDDGERERTKLYNLDRESDLGDVVIELKAGVYIIDEALTIKGAETVILRGQGPNKTRLLLDTDDSGSLVIRGAKKVRIEGLTVVAFLGDGIRIKKCPDVKVMNAHFAGSYHGLALEGSTAHVGSSAFSGCQRGIMAKKSSVEVEATAFADCWTAILGRNSGFKIKSSVFLDNRNVLKATVDGRTELVGNLIFGERQELGWSGRPALAAHNLVHFRHLGEEMGKRTNRELQGAEDFPDNVRWPEGFDVVTVHLAKFRIEKRGESDPPSLMSELRRQRAQQSAEACQKALRARKIDAARTLAKLARTYWGPQRELEDAPKELKEIVSLAK